MLTFILCIGRRIVSCIAHFEYLFHRRTWSKTNTGYIYSKNDVLLCCLTENHPSV